MSPSKGGEGGEADSWRRCRKESRNARIFRLNTPIFRDFAAGWEKAWFENFLGRGPRRGDESAATVLLVAGRSIMGLVPPFDRRDVETFEDGVSYISNLWIDQLTLCTHSVYNLYTNPLSFRVNPTCFRPLIGSIVVEHRV